MITTDVYLQKIETLTLKDDDSDYRLIFSEALTVDGTLIVTVHDGETDHTFVADEDSVAAIRAYLDEHWKPITREVSQTAVIQALRHILTGDSHRNVHINSCVDKETPLRVKVGSRGTFVGMEISETFTSATADTGTVTLGVDQMIELHAHLDKLINEAKSMIK